MVACDRMKARCEVCLTTFDISNMGEAALRSHAKGEKHRKRVSELSDSKTNHSIAVFYGASQTATSAATAATGITTQISARQPCQSGLRVSVDRFMRVDVMTSRPLRALLSTYS